MATFKHSVENLIMHNTGMSSKLIVAIVGAGPSGLMAAESIASSPSSQCFDVHVYDAMPSVGRKFLLAGRGGLNITHSEPIEKFLQRYSNEIGETDNIQKAVRAFDAQSLTQWVNGLGITTFVGSSGRIFPHEMKAAPLLRAWMTRLKNSGVKFHSRSKLVNLSPPTVNKSEIDLYFETADSSQRKVGADACVLALGGASWARLGSDGAWAEWLEKLGLQIAPLEPANCGFNCTWSDFIRSKYAGCAIKNCALSVGRSLPIRGEFVLTESGIEGQLVYALSSLLRADLKQNKIANLFVDLKPDKTQAQVFERLTSPRGSRSIAKHLQSTLNLTGQYSALLRELAPASDFTDMHRLASRIKSLHIKVTSSRPVDEAISTAGGIGLNQMSSGLMLGQFPGLFAAGEMLDWEAPTGGYLLNACFATGKVAGQGVCDFLISKLNGLVSQPVPTQSQQGPSKI
jgi:uncharacterized flavoprotein (TIGR03862 family)